jgi:hypothetical protein
MEPRPADAHPRLPATRPPQPPVPHQPPAPDEPGPAAPPPRPRFSWPRFARSPRGAVGLVLVAAALLLWPFSGWSWIPLAAGVGLLILLRLLRLDKLLRNWDLHLAGLVVVAGLMLSTGPWAWALAGSIGVLIAGLAQLPWWRLAAVGAVLCVISGIGFGVTQFQVLQRAVEQTREVGQEIATQRGASRPDVLLPVMLREIGLGNSAGVCVLLDEAAEQEFVRASGAADCPAAVAAFRKAAGPALSYQNLDADTVQTGNMWVTDGCRTSWAEPPLGGPGLGRLEIRQAPAPGSTYFIAAFRPC